MAQVWKGTRYMSRVVAATVVLLQLIIMSVICMCLSGVLRGVSCNVAPESRQYDNYYGHDGGFMSLTLLEYDSERLCTMVPFGLLSLEYDGSGDGRTSDHQGFVSENDKKMNKTCGFVKDERSNEQNLSTRPGDNACKRSRTFLPVYIPYSTNVLGMLLNLLESMLITPPPPRPPPAAPMQQGLSASMSALENRIRMIVGGPKGLLNCLRNTNITRRSRVRKVEERGCVSQNLNGEKGKEETECNNSNSDDEILYSYAGVCIGLENLDAVAVDRTDKVMKKVTTTDPMGFDGTNRRSTTSSITNLEGGITAAFQSRAYYSFLWRKLLFTQRTLNHLSEIHVNTEEELLQRQQQRQSSHEPGYQRARRTTRRRRRGNSSDGRSSNDMFGRSSSNFALFLDVDSQVFPGWQDVLYGVGNTPCGRSTLTDGTCDHPGMFPPTADLCIIRSRLETASSDTDEPHRRDSGSAHTHDDSDGGHNVYFQREAKDRINSGVVFVDYTKKESCELWNHAVAQIVHLQKKGGKTNDQAALQKVLKEIDRRRGGGGAKGQQKSSSNDTTALFRLQYTVFPKDLVNAGLLRVVGGKQQEQKHGVVLPIIQHAHMSGRYKTEALLRALRWRLPRRDDLETSLDSHQLRRTKRDEEKRSASMIQYHSGCFLSLNMSTSELEQALRSPSSTSAQSLHKCLEAHYSASNDPESKDHVTSDDDQRKKKKTKRLNFMLRRFLRLLSTLVYPKREATATASQHQQRQEHNEQPVVSIQTSTKPFYAQQGQYSPTGKYETGGIILPPKGEHTLSSPSSSSVQQFNQEIDVGGDPSVLIIMFLIVLFVAMVFRCRRWFNIR